MKNKKHSNMRILAILGLVTLIAVTGCIDNEKSTDVNVTPVQQVTPEQEVSTTPVQPGTPEPVISSGTTGMIERYSLDKLVSISDSVVIAEVIGVSPSRWNTQDGEKPVVNGSDSTSYTIYTDVNVKILEYIKGSSSNTVDNTVDNTVITVRVLGGTVGQDEQYVEDQPSYNVNEKVLIFLKNDNDPRTKDVGNKHMTTVGLIQGKISIPVDNEIIIGDTKMSLTEAKVIITGKGEKKYGSI